MNHTETLEKTLALLESRGVSNPSIVDEITALIDALPDTFDVSSGMFSRAVLNLVVTGEPLLVDNICLTINALSPKTVKRPENDEIIEDVYVESEAEKLARLLDIAENTEEYVEDFDVTDLTENGLRSIGVLGDFDTSLDADDLNLKIDCPKIYVSSEAEIVSPFGEENELYRVDHNTFMDIETGEIFKVFWR